MAQILFGQSYFLHFDPKLWREMKPYPPLGCLYAASTVRERGHDVSFFDAMLADSEEEWGDRCREVAPAFAVLFEDNFNYLTKMCLLRMREAAFEMIKLAKQTGAIVIVCGSDASDHVSEYLDAGAEYIIVGEGEAALLELLACLDGKEPRQVGAIAGIGYLNASQEATRTPPRPAIRDLDNLPFPAWDLVDFDRYRDIWIDRHGFFSLNMVTTRGCPYHCNWCAKPIWGQTYNSRSPENVVEEMRMLRELAKPDHIWFMDDIMGLKPNWLARFADLLEQHDLKIPFKCLSRADLVLRADDAENLARAGCQTVWIGAESGSQDVLDAMEKGITVEQIKQAANKLRDLGIGVGLFIQFGYIGEQRRDIDRTFSLVKTVLPDQLGVSVSYPLRGTKFHELVKDTIAGRANWVDSDDLSTLYQARYVPEFYRQLHKLLHGEWRLRKYLTGLLDRDGRRRHMRDSGPRGLMVMFYDALRLPWLRGRVKLLEIVSNIISYKRRMTSGVPSMTFDRAPTARTRDDLAVAEDVDS